MNTKYKSFATYCIIILIQIMVVLYWSHIKTNYHVDELYSLGYSSCFTGAGDQTLYITTSQDFDFNRWIKNQELRKYLILSDQEKFYNSSPDLFFAKLVSGRSYFGLLNIAESLFGNSDISQKPSLILNIIFYIIAEVFLVLLLKNLHVDKQIRYLCLIMFGFSSYMISMVEYIRFYMFIIMLAFIVLYLFNVMWNSDRWKTIILSELTIIILIYVAYRNSELTMPFFGSLLICIMIAQIVGKKMKQLYSCACIFAIGLIYLLITTDYIGILFAPDKYNYYNNVWVSSSMNISNASIGSVKEYCLWLRELLITHYFASLWMVYLLMGAVTICIILKPSNTEKGYKDAKTGSISPAIVAAFIFWITVLVISFVTGHMRAFSSLMVYIIILIGAAKITGYTPRFRMIHLSNDSLFVTAILGEAIIYTLFEALCQHEIWRYYCYGFISVSLVGWYVADRLIKCNVLSGCRRYLIHVLFVFVIINALVPFRIRNIENIYEDERDFVNSINTYRDLDVVIASEIEGDTVSRHEAYDCVNRMPEQTDICFVDINKYRYDELEYPEEFVLWTYMDRDITSLVRDLESQGYNISELGSDHCSKAFVCKM